MKSTMLSYTFTCAQCGKKEVFSARTTRGVFDKARDKSWAISTKHKNAIQWCPTCAPFHRHPGRGGERQFIQTVLNV